MLQVWKKYNGFVSFRYHLTMSVALIMVLSLPLTKIAYALSGAWQAKFEGWLYWATPWAEGSISRIWCPNITIRDMKCQYFFLLIQTNMPVCCKCYSRFSSRKRYKKSCLKRGEIGNRCWSEIIPYILVGWDPLPPVIPCYLFGISVNFGAWWYWGDDRQEC